MAQRDSGAKERHGVVDTHVKAASKAINESPLVESVLSHFKSDASNILSGIVDGFSKAAVNLELLQAFTKLELEACREQETTTRKNIEQAVIAFENEIAACEERNKINEDIITLCVGGSNFTTTLETLKKDPESMLGIMFSGRHAIHRQSDGSIFIDRDPTHFRHVLNFLRDGPSALPPRESWHEFLDSNGQVPLPHPKIVVRQELLHEAQFYQIKNMIDELADDERARREEICIAAGGHIKEVEDSIRARLLSSDKNVSHQAEVEATDMCFDIYSRYSMFAADPDSAPPEGCSLFFGDSKLRGWRLKQHLEFAGNESELHAICDENCFMENFRVMTLGAFNLINWDGLVVAGGSVLGCLLPVPSWASSNDQNRLYYHSKAISEVDEDLFEHDLGVEGRDTIPVWATPSDYFAPYCNFDLMEDTSGWEASDIDLFLVGLSSEEAQDKIRHVHSILSAAWGATPDNNKLLVVRTESAITFIGGWPRRHVQIILRLYRSVAEVLLGFDIDACCVAFNGTQVLGLPRVERALTKCINVVDPSRRSTTYEARLYKYALRGFAVVVPSFDESKVRWSKVTNPETHGLSRLLGYEQHQKACQTQRPSWYSSPVTLFNTEDISVGSSLSSRRLKNRLKGIVTSDYCNALSKMDFLEFNPQLSCEGHTSTLSGIDLVIRKASISRSMSNRSLPFIFSRDIEMILRWPEGEPLKTSEGEISHPTSIQSQIAFIAFDPGRQFTGSFQPDDRDWFAHAYGEDDSEDNK